MNGTRRIEDETLQVARIGDLEFHYVEAGEGPALVFVHGVLGDWKTWAPQWPAFTPHFRSISYSRRYNVPNRNDRPSPDHSALIEAQDLAALLDRWRTGPAVLVGSSYGAFTALALAVSAPSMIRAMVLLEPPMLGWAAFSEEGRKIRADFEQEVRLPARAAFERGDDAVAFQLLTGGIVGAEVAARQSAQARRQRLANIRAIRMLTLSTDEFPMLEPQALRRLQMPIAMMAGASTPPIHDVVFRAVCAALPNAEVSRIDGAGHGAARDNPAEFNRRALDFLQRALSR